MPKILTNRLDQSDQHLQRQKNYAQSLSMALGTFLIVLGLAGILSPEFMGLHLSPMHSLVLIASGIFSLWTGLNDELMNVYYASVGLCLFFSIHALVGFLLGEPGTPTVGYDAPDESLVRIAPGFLELGTIDHILHFLLATFYLTGALSLNKDSRVVKSRRRVRGK